MNDDKIFIKDLRFQCILGIHPREREQAQEVVLNLTIFTSTKAAAATDDLLESVDYESLSQRVIDLAQNKQPKTVEALAEDIATMCLSMSKVEKVTVRIEKPQALSYAAAAGVEITRP